MRPHGSQIDISVRDNGGGIDPSLVDRIFEPFVQADRSLARTEGGLGLGLALVKAVVELHGGTVRVESEGRGHGSEFVVTLPLARPPHTERVAAARSAERVNSRRVLIVDDNRDAAETLAELVAMFGHTVDVVYDGASAMKVVDAT